MMQKSAKSDSDHTPTSHKPKVLPHVTLSDGHTMPQFGLGVWQTPAEETSRIVQDAAKLGYPMIDTASYYQNEKGVGDAARYHPDLFITTKLWNDDQGYDETLAAFDKSAKLLQRDCIDLYLIHWPAPRKNRFIESWKAMIRLKKEGRVRSIGVSNFTPEHLTRLMDETGEKPVVNQIELHPDFQQRELRAFHQRHGIQTQSWSPLGRASNLDNPTLKKLAAKHHKSAAQIVIRWHLDEGLIVIPKSVRHDRLIENISVFDFHLDKEDIQQIALLDRKNGRAGPDPMTADF